MATKQVNIDIIAKDKTRQAMRSATGSVDRLKDSVFNLRNALLGLGAGVVAKSFIDTGREVERLRVRFKFLFDEASEGEKAFKGLIKFASQVPFSLEEIQRGSANLAVVSKDADELNKLLKITGDIASASGLDFQTTAEQIQRTFAGGINSADLFRERGVRALLGFEAGVAISAEQSRNHILKAFEEGTLSVVGASSVMAKTFDGTLSMIGDKFNLFKMAVMDAGPFDFLKASAMIIEKELEKNFGGIEKSAEKIGDAIVATTVKTLLFATQVLDTFKPVFDFIGSSIAGLVNFVRALPPPLDSIGVIGFLMLGSRGKLLVAVIAGVIDEIRGLLGSVIDGIAFVQEKLNSFTLFRSEEQIQKVKEQIQAMRESAEQLRKPFGDVVDEMNKIGENGKIVFEGLGVTIDADKIKAGGLTEALMKQLEVINKIMEANKLNRNTDEKENDKIKKEIEEVGMLEKAYASFSKGFTSAMDTQKDAFKQVEEIGKASFGKLKATLTDFVMTGKLSFGDLAKFVVKAMVEMLIGQAIQFAFKKSLALFKSNAIIEGSINIIRGALETFAKIPFPLNIVAVGGAIAFGTSLLNRIKSFEKGGRPPVGQPSIVGEKGAELFVPDQAGTIVPNDQLGMGKQVTVNFNITTVDAKGFNTLLVNSRGTIINMINSAMNEKGKMAII